jgi:hypothetical protein
MGVYHSLKSWRVSTHVDVIEWSGVSSRAVEYDLCCFWANDRKDT